MGSNEKFEWDGYYGLRDGRITAKRSQGAYDAQKHGRFPFDEAIRYVTRALKVTSEEAEKMLIKHRDRRLYQVGSSGNEWHHVGPEGEEKAYFDARELAVWKKLEAVDAEWPQNILKAGREKMRTGGEWKDGEAEEIVRLAKKSGLSPKKIESAFMVVPSEMKIEKKLD